MTYRHVQSPNCYPTRNRQVSRIGIHCTQSPDNSAPGVAQFFSHASVKASAHAVCDTDEVITCVHAAQTAWAMPHVNADGYHIELCGYAEWSHDQWLSKDHGLSVLHVGSCVAAQAVTMFRYFHSPFQVHWLSDAEVKAGTGFGFIEHRTATRLLGPADGHTDPGSNFPAAEFLDMVNWWMPQITAININ